MDLVKISAEVNLSIVFGSVDLVGGYFNMWLRIPVFDSDVIVGAVIDTDAGCRARFSNND